MRNAHYTKQERAIIFWLRLLTIAFLGSGALLLLIPQILFQYIDNIGLVFLNFPSAPLSETEFDFWRIISLVGIFLLTYAAFSAQWNWLRNHNMVPMIILAKAITAISFASLAYWQEKHFFYIVGAAVDGVLCLVTLYAYAKALTSRTFQQFKVG